MKRQATPASSHQPKRQATLGLAAVDDQQKLEHIESDDTCSHSEHTCEEVNLISSFTCASQSQGANELYQHPASSIHSWESQENHPFATQIPYDSIRSFSDEDDSALPEDVASFNTASSMSYILDGLDTWQPSTSHDQCDVDTILESWTDDDEKIMESPHTSEAQPKQHETKVASLQFQLPRVLPPIYRHDLRGDQQRMNPIKFKPNGLAVQALENIMSERDKHMAWDRRVKSEMAKVGCIARACRNFDGGQLFRLVETWTQHGLTFGWCVAVKEFEMSMISSTFAAENDFDTIEEDFPAPIILPPYTPSPDDDRCLFLFSFAYMQVTEDRKLQFLRDNCVGIWSPWSVVSMIINDEKHNVHIATRFMTDSLY
ncbi:hypothetical protein EC973_003323 [Apophysomyces ossiformis]|uniref:Uncharacterized protein n=1 Tax=Apophysomyces ossiformis TaxID=679940 RepID=A0A8H7BW91_9FUNG|nr:hypothetical protein EC973_003323 [Apophysomyces ossiformis]